MNRRSFLQSVGVTLAFPASGAFAQIAGRPIRVVVPLPAGSSNDYVTRVIAPYLTTSLGHTIVVDNKAGGNGIIGTMDVVKSPPDGNTLLLGSLSPLATNVALVKNLPYDPRRDLTPIAGVERDPLGAAGQVVVARAHACGIRRLCEAAAWQRQHRLLDHDGAGADRHAEQDGRNRTAGRALQGHAGDDTPTSSAARWTRRWSIRASAMAQVKGGRMRALGVSSLKRNPITPDWPAISETYPGFDFSAWNALMGPPGMSRDIVTKINAAMNAALKQKDVIAKYAEAGTQPLVMTPEEVKTFIEAEIAKWVRLAKEANIQPESI